MNCYSKYSYHLCNYFDNIVFFYMDVKQFLAQLKKKDSRIFTIKIKIMVLANYKVIEGSKSINQAI